MLKKYYELAFKDEIYVNGEKICIDLMDSSECCDYVIFPILCNMNDVSEVSIIQLRHLYKKYIDYMSNILFSNQVSSFDQLPFSLVTKLDTMSKIFKCYIMSLGVKKYLPDFKDEEYNLNPKIKTPICQFIYDEVNSKFKLLNEILKEKEIVDKEENLIEELYG